MNTETFREVFSNELHPKIHATISETERVQLLGFLHYPYKIGLCDTLNIYILMTIEEADYYWH